MFTLLKSSVSVAVLALFCAPALGADLPSSTKDGGSHYATESGVRAASWTGPWIGIAGGYTFFNSELDYFHDVIRDDVRTNVEHANVNGLGAEGLFGELQAGYDHQVGSNVVVGIFGGINLSDAQFEASYSAGEDFDAKLTTDYEWGGVLGARIGMLATPNTLVYAAGGWAFGQLGDTKISATETDAFIIDGPELSGWFAEVGAETRISGNLYLTVAGRYTDYGTETLWANDDPICPKEVEIDTDNLAVLVGLKAKLGGFGN